MGVNQEPTEKGRKAAGEFERSAKNEERKVEAEKGSPLKKGAARVQEWSKSSDGKGAGAKQR